MHKAIIIILATLAAQFTFAQDEAVYQRVYDAARAVMDNVDKGDFTSFKTKQKRAGLYLDPKLNEFVDDLADTTIEIQTWHSIQASMASSIYYYQENGFNTTKNEPAYYYYITGILIEDDGEKAWIREKWISTKHDAFETWWTKAVKFCQGEDYAIIPEQYNSPECPPKP